MHLGRLVAIHRFPVKALRGETLAAADVLADGIAGDRTAALIVAGERHARAGKTLRGKEHARLHTVESAADGVREAAGAGVDVVVAAHGRYFDVHPISLIFDTWIGDLEALAGTAVEALRFRPNLVAAAAPGFASREAALVGARLRIGTTELQVLEPIDRCVTPSFDLRTGERNSTIARALAVERGNVMGVYCAVATPGRLACNDDIVEITSSGGLRALSPR